MTSSSDVTQEILSTLKSLRGEVAQLSERVAALETERENDVSEQLVLTISAAVAAYLGVRPKIRQIRLVSNPQWSQHGRATIQASHELDSRSSF